MTGDLDRTRTDDPSWDRLGDAVEGLVNAWESGEGEPDLAEFVIADPPSLRRLSIVELIKVDLEYRWVHRDAPRRIEDYGEVYRELSQQTIPTDLLYEEIHVRKQAGDLVELEEYQERFPEAADALARLLGVDDGSAPTRGIVASRPTDLEIGDSLDDFDLLNLVGEGSFARVFLARQRSMLRMVALKISADRGDEPQTLAQLNHPDIVRVYDQRTLAERGLRLLYMEFVPGGTLKNVVEALQVVARENWSGRVLVGTIDQSLDVGHSTRTINAMVRSQIAEFSWAETVAWLGARLARALHYAHSRGVLHRDIKPANVLLTADCTPKLADFNVSSSETLPDTNPAAYFGGSLAYMSPEQLDVCDPDRDRAVEDLDARSDVYALGIVLWELASSRRPFSDDLAGNDWSQAVRALAESRRERPEQFAGFDAIPEALRNVLSKCLSHSPDERFPDGEALAAELDLCRHPEAQSLVRPERTSWRIRARRWPVLWVVLAALVPNLLVAIFNYAYNKAEIIDRIDGAEEVFSLVQRVINFTAFPLGVLLGGWFLLPVLRGMESFRRGELDGEPGLRRAAWQRSLKLGHLLAVLSAVEWSLAGIAYPVALAASLPELPGSAWLHFSTSLVLCGLASASYPFFTVGRLAVSSWAPLFLGDHSRSESGEKALDRVTRISWIYLALSACVPMFAVVVLILAGSENRLALGTLSGAALVGFVWNLILSRGLQRDIGALRDAAKLGARPNEKRDSA
ncbi:MAG: serine/threonine-protein kinase [Planctomycetota bacterium]